MKFRRYRPGTGDGAKRQEELDRTRKMRGPTDSMSRQRTRARQRLFADRKPRPSDPLGKRARVSTRVILEANWRRARR
jgi:hypothetical protein